MDVNNYNNYYNKYQLEISEHVNFTSCMTNYYYYYHYKLEIYWHYKGNIVFLF
jgi:hypothetical protein